MALRQRGRKIIEKKAKVNMAWSCLAASILMTVLIGVAQVRADTDITLFPMPLTLIPLLAVSFIPTV